MTAFRRISGPWLAFGTALTVHVLISAFYPLPGSFSKYTLAAEQHLAGQLPRERLMDLSPLYFEMVLAATRLTPSAEVALVAVQIVLVAAATGFLASLAWRRFGGGLAALGVLVFTFDRHVLAYERIPEPEACLLFFVLGWIFFLELTPSNRASTAAAGLMAAASLLTRPTFLPVALVMPLWFRARGEQPWLRRSVVFAVPVLAAFALLLVRAGAVTGDPRTPVMNPGTVLYEGNQPLSRGTSAVYPISVSALIGPEETGPDIAHVHYRTIARAATGRDLSISEVNAYWSSLATDFIRAEPVRFLGLVREKLARVLHDYRWHDVTAAWRFDQTLRLPFVSFAVIAALAVLGMLFEARRRPLAWSFFVLAALQVAVMLVFYVSARQRMLLLPAAIYFALAGLEGLVREKRAVRRLGLVAFVLLLVLSFALPNDLVRDDLHVRFGNWAAQAKLEELRERARAQPTAVLAEEPLDALRHVPWVEWTPAYFPQEERSLAEALADVLAAEAKPGVPATFDRAMVFLRAGRLEEAETLLEELVASGGEVYRGGWQSSLPRFHLARIAAARGRRDRAVELLEEALARAPGDPLVHAELFVLTGEPAHEVALGTGISAIDAQLLLGRALLHHGRAREASGAFAFVIERVPELRHARIYLAAALGEAGRVDEAAALYLDTVRAKPDPLLLSRRVSELFRRWAAQHPDDPQVLLPSAHVLHEHGRFSTALELLEGVEPPEEMKARWEHKLRQLRQAMTLANHTNRRRADPG